MRALAQHGRHRTVDELLAAGHAVTAYARNPAKIPARWGGNVRVVIGEMSDAAAIDTTVAGADAVVSALGPSMDRKGHRASPCGGHREHSGLHETPQSFAVHWPWNPQCPGSPGKADPANPPSHLPTFMARTFLPRAYKELLGMAGLIMQSGLDWTIVRFAAPKNTPKTGKLRVGFYGFDKLGIAVSRADIAAFTAAQVGDEGYLRAAPAISN